jgi:hypothetical protein
MNIDTGKIIDNDKYKSLFEDQKQKYEEVYISDMTDKQKKNKQVSLNDHTSELGKRLTHIRSMNGLTKNQKRNLRKKGFIK